MRKIVHAATAVLGLIVVGMAVIDHSSAIRLTDPDGGGVSARATRHSLLAMIDEGHRGRPLLVRLQNQ